MDRIETMCLKNIFRSVTLFVLLLAGCMPSESAIQTAIAQTQVAFPTASFTAISQPVNATPSATAEPSPTPTATIPPTATPLPLEITDARDVKMVLVPSGEFIMGSNFPADEGPIHQVYLDAFYMDIYEVTNLLYYLCVDAGRCTPPQKTSSNSLASYYGNSQYDNYPVIYVDWNQAQAYCEWRGGSLPTEAQWEKASRGTDGRTYPWGDEFAGNRVNFCDKNCLAEWAEWRSDDGYAGTAPVGSYESGKSPYGIYDLAGNVWEWVADWYSDTYYQSSPASNPLGPDSGQYRVMRGASWGNVNLAGNIRSANRDELKPDSFDSNVGFRCARDLNP